MWDILLANRIATGRPVIYGLAVDDAHHYHSFGPRKVNPGRGWIKVKAKELTAASIIAAMEAGDFYASTGVEFDRIDFDGERLALKIAAEEGVSYTTKFFGTLRGFVASVTMDTDSTGRAVATRYSTEIGLVLKKTEGISPSYRFSGNEWYVRAQVISSRLKDNPQTVGELETAWTQPFQPN